VTVTIYISVSVANWLPVSSPEDESATMKHVTSTADDFPRQHSQSPLVCTADISPASFY